MIARLLALMIREGNRVKGGCNRKFQDVERPPPPAPFTPNARLTTGYQPRDTGTQLPPPSGGSAVVFREGTSKKGGLNPDPTDYRPPPPRSFVPKTKLNIPLPPPPSPPPLRHISEAGYRSNYTPCPHCGR